MPVQPRFMFRYVYSQFHELFDGSYGLALPGNGTTLAVSDARRELVRQAT